MKNKNTDQPGNLTAKTAQERTTIAKAAKYIQQLILIEESVWEACDNGCFEVGVDVIVSPEYKEKVIKEFENRGFKISADCGAHRNRFMVDWSKT